MTELLLAILIGLKQPDKPRIIPLERSTIDQVDIYAEIWDELAPQAKSIVWCESRGDRFATNGVHIGLFQINYKIWGKEYGVTRDDLFDERINNLVAKRIYDRSGNWKMWDCQKAVVRQDNL